MASKRGFESRRAMSGRAARSPLVLLGIVAALIALSVVLNPSADTHRARIKTAIAERDKISDVLGIGQFKSFAARYHSLGVMSYTELNEHMVSLGVLGMVFVRE
jgi:hypothetical protein